MVWMNKRRKPQKNLRYCIEISPCLWVLKIHPQTNINPIHESNQPKQSYVP